MATNEAQLSVLVVDDEPEFLDLFRRTFPRRWMDVELLYDFFDDFEKAKRALQAHRYDLVLSDTYLGSVNVGRSSGAEVAAFLRGGKFIPMVLFSAGSMPEGLASGPFLRWADKSEDGGIELEMSRLLETGVPMIARELHDELDGIGGSYLWDFLESRWEDELQRQAPELLQTEVLRRLIRRRAAFQLADWATPRVAEAAEVFGLEYYIYPAPTVGDLSLGTVLLDRQGESVHVLLTPHCHLICQPGADTPKADWVLLAGTVSFKDVILLESQRPAKPAKREQWIRRAVGVPAEVGKPRGRYWFLPGFLRIPDCFVDLMQLTSCPYTEIETRFERLAVLAPPFAESLQASVGQLYGSVGLPVLRPGKQLLDWDDQ